MRQKAELMANRMRYIQTLLKNIRSEVSTEELLLNEKILKLIRVMETQLKQMEITYVGKSHEE